jgi:hypothetical protein
MSKFELIQPKFHSIKNILKPTLEEKLEWLKKNIIGGGVSSIAWKWPKTTAPVAPVGTNTVKGTVTLDGSDTTLTITHNLGFSVAELAANFPEVVIEFAAAAEHTSDVYISSKTANTVVLTYLAVANSLFITIKRPISSEK